MNSLEVSFRLLTPMFLRGYDLGQPELRVSSLKGCLRYWFRAIHPQYVQREAELFGSSNQGQSSVLFRLDHTELKSQRNNRMFHQKSLGYFCFSLKGGREQPASPYLLPDQQFTLRCFLRPSMEEKQKELQASIWMLGHVGSVGSRARRGFGSLLLESWQQADLPLLANAHHLNEAVERFQQGLRTIYHWFPGDYSEKHTTFPPTTSFFVHPKGERYWDTALRKAQEVLEIFRKQNKLHRLMFGLPVSINKPRIDVLSHDAKRIASPIYLRLWKIDNLYYPVFFFLQSPFPTLFTKRQAKPPISKFDYQKARDSFATHLQATGYRKENCQ